MDGMTWHLIATNEKNDGNYIWNIGSMEDGSYRVKVVARDNAGHEGMDISNIFTINNIPLSVTLDKPRNYLYIADREIIPLPIPVIIGKISIIA